MTKPNVENGWISQTAAGGKQTQEEKELPMRTAGSTAQHHNDTSNPQGPQSLLKDLKLNEGPTKCTWTPTSNPADSPHKHIPYKKRPAICDSVLEVIGDTPMVRLGRISKAEGIECDLLAKCEYFNAGGSVKDRIGRRMIEDAERDGRIKPGDVLIEPTSGNTGIGLALSAALKGYRCIITLPEKMSQEKVDVLKALGAEIIRTPTEAAWDSPESHIGVAKRLNKEIPNSHILDQYANPSNPLAHYDGTAEEMIQQCDSQIDAVVIAAGTGGTITGIARKFRERLPKTKIIGVDPYGSILALPDSLNGVIESYKVEGIGYDFIPDVLDRSLVDEWIKVNDKDAFRNSRRLIREEGLLVGGSAGTALTAAIHVAKRYKKGQRVVVLMADSVRNYMTKYLNDSWMEENGFMEFDSSRSPKSWWSKHSVNELNFSTPVTVSPDMPASTCIEILNRCGYDQMPVVDADGSIMGVVALGNLTSQITSARVNPDDPISKAIYKQFRKVTMRTTLGELSHIFDRDHFALVVTTQRQFNDAKDVTKTTEKSMIAGLVTRIDLLNYIVAAERKYQAAQSSPVNQAQK